MTEHPHARKYFHDRFVLLLLTINIFLTIVCVATVFFRLGDTSASYIESYRANLGLDAYSVGGVSQIISFAVFSVIVVVGQAFLSFRLHRIRKEAAWMVMVLAMLLLILSVVVSDSLLQLR